MRENKKEFSFVELAEWVALSIAMAAGAYWITKLSLSVPGILIRL